MPAPTPTTPASSVRQGDWKLIRLYCDNGDKSNRHELYNLADDPGERHDLASTQPRRVKKLAARLENFLRETTAVIPTANPDYNPAAKPTKAKPAAARKPNPLSTSKANP